jgi:hypothetical protein
MPRVPTIPSELAGAVRRGKREGRLGAEHGLDIARARLLTGMLIDGATPRSAIAALDRRLDVILSRLGFVADATGPSELDEWLSGLADELVPADEGENGDELRSGSPESGANDPGGD